MCEEERQRAILTQILLAFLMDVQDFLPVGVHCWSQSPSSGLFPEGAFALLVWAGTRRAGVMQKVEWPLWAEPESSKLI